MSDKTRVLVVDDDEAIVRLARHVLAKRGFDVEIAVDGEEALEKARSLKPDVIVSDVMMPKVDGLELIRSLRADPAFALVPVIFLSALGSTEDRLKGLRLGADDYLPKPFHLEELAMRVAIAAKHRARLRHTLRLRAEFLTRNDAKDVEPGLRGSLEQVALSALLSLFAVDAMSGLVVVRNEGSTARLVVNDGRVVSASLEGHKAVSGREAVLTVLGWSSGTFEYDALTVDADDEIGLSTAQLLVEAARRQNAS